MGPYIERYVGTTTPHDMNEVQAIPDSAFFPVGTASPLGIREASWFRFSVRNNSSRPRSFVLDFDQSLYGKLEWLARSATTSKHVLTGQNYPFFSRDINYDYFAFQMDIPPGETLTVNFSAYTTYASLFVPKLSDSERFLNGATFSGRFTGGVMGMLYSICFFLFLYVLRLRALSQAHIMLAFSFMCLLSVMYINGAVQRLLPDTVYPWRDAAYILIHGLQGMAFGGVLRSFYQSARHNRLLDKCLIGLLFIESIIFVLLPWANIEYLVFSIQAINTLFLLFALPLSFTAILKRRVDTYLFSAGLLLFVVMSMISVMGSVGALPVSFMTRYGYELGLTIQVDFLFLAVASRMFSVEREKIAMQMELVKLNADMQARSEFVDRVTHDVKSPLTAVLGAEQLLRSTNNPANRERYLDIIRTACGTVVTIVDDILHHSRIGQGQLVLRNDPFDLQKLLEEIEASFRAGHMHNAVSFSVSLAEVLPSVVVGDKVRVYQILANLLNNAFKFTDAGQVLLRVELAEKKADHVRIRFIVQDTGIGMSAAFLGQAFNSYSREDNRSGYRPGFGLGLAICKQLVDLMGGTIDVQSASGEGSRFTVDLPFTLLD
jgi:signal transduction histidine kinase